jgi:uncharacterized protein (DUF58 family)
MSKKAPSWLDPQLLSLPQGLMLLAKTALHRLEGGLHRSRSSGEEQEFSQYRAYQPGDDLRLLDWKLYARSRRLYVRQAEVPRQLQVLLLLDASASMQHQSGRWTKLTYAKAVAAILGLLAHRQNDVPGLQILSSEYNRQLLFQRSRHHLEAYLQLLEDATAGGRWPQAMPPSLLQQARQAGLIIVLTDLYEAEEEVKKSLGQLMGAGRDLWVVQLLAPEEEDPRLLKSGQILQDLETGERLQLRSGSDKQASAEAFARWQEDWKSWLQRRGISHVALNIGEDPLQLLRDYLHLKSKAEQW